MYDHVSQSDQDGIFNFIQIFWSVHTTEHFAVHAFKQFDWSDRSYRVSGKRSEY